MAAPHSLTVDRRSEPFGIDTAAPEFGWKLLGAAGQESYEVEVALTPSFEPSSVVWASGEVPARRPFGVLYGGTPLASGTTYHWRVRVRDTDGGMTEWADATFETGILDASQWHARWISHPESNKNEPRTLYFRTELDLPAPVVRGRAYASALGWYRLFVNDTNVTGHALVPRWTPFHDYTEYQAYDVTDAFRAGSNRIGIVVSEGRYRGRLGAFSLRARYGDRLGAFAQLELELADGSTVRVTTDGTWRVGYGRVLRSDPKDGERVDLRLPELPWTEEGASGETVTVVLEENPRLVAEEVQRVTEIGRRNGTVSTTPSGKQLIDFGQNFSGVARVRLSGTAGQAVKLLYSEVLDSDGEVATTYLGVGSGKGEWFQRDEAVLTGQPVDYTPWFTIHGFRYLCIDGPVQPLTEEDVEAIVLSSDLPQIAEFRSSDPRLDRLWNNVLWSLRSNFTDTPTDCPTRERSGWTGDIQVFGPTAAQMVDADAYLRRYLRNLAAEQYEDGTVPPFIPAEEARGRSRNPMRFTRTSVGWGDAAVILPWTLHRYYGDVEVLRTQYDSGRAWVDHLARRAATKRGWRRRFRNGTGPLERYIVDTGYHWGEWLRPGDSLGSEIPGNLTGKRAGVATAYLAHSAGLLSQIATVLDRTEDAAGYRQLANSAAEAWRAAFVRDGGGRIADDKQDDYVRGLAFGLLEPPQRPAAAARLVELIEENGFHLGTGFLSTPMLLGSLVEAGHPDIAYRVLLQTTTPSWLSQVELGATTTWETWEGYKDGNPTASHNHYAFGSVAAFLQEYVAGLSPAAPGYARIRVAPVIGGGLTSASVSVETPYGRAASAWELQPDGTVSLSVTVPAGVTAELDLGALHKEVGSGTYDFTSTLAPVPAP
ncbi:family 78 glycoside hydrolase catalytic domain [Streptomyces sp. NPDC002643]